MEKKIKLAEKLSDLTEEQLKYYYSQVNIFRSLKIAVPTNLIFKKARLIGIN